MNIQISRLKTKLSSTGLPQWAISAAFVLGLIAGVPSHSAAAIEQPVAADVTIARETARVETQYLPLTQLAEQYGIKITQVAVTGAGGLVDFRFKVLDPEKARKLVGQPPTMPELVAGGSDLKLATSHKMMHAIRLQKDAVSYALYPNVRGAVKPGTPVSVAFGELRVEPVKAQ